MGNTLAPCAAGIPMNAITGCTRVLDTRVGKQYKEYDDEIVTGRCLIETRVNGPRAAFAANEAAILTVLNNVDTAAYTQARPVCSSA